MKWTLLLVAATTLTGGLLLYWLVRRPSPATSIDDAVTLREILAAQRPDLQDPPAVHRSSESPRHRPSWHTRYQTDIPDVLFTMEFSYLGRTGQYTRRAVGVQVCDPEFFAGHCHLRNEYRTFAWNNIQGFVRLLESKEIVEVGEARARFTLETEAS